MVVRLCMGNSYPQKKLSSCHKKPRGVDGWPSSCPSSLLTIRIDTREQKPWTFSEVSRKVVTTVGTLKSGDYALDIDPTIAAVERKSLNDFVRCCGVGREAFWKQIQLLKGSIERPLIIIEADYSCLEMGGWRGRMTPEQILATLHTITNMVPVMLCRNRNEAARACTRHLRLAMSDRYKKCREFARQINDPPR